VNRRAVVTALAIFVAVLAPATDSHASGFSYAFATAPQVTTPGTFSSAITAVASVDGDMTIDVAGLAGTTITATDIAGCMLTTGGEHCVVTAVADTVLTLPFAGSYTGIVVNLQTTASDAAGPVSFAADTTYLVPPAGPSTQPVMTSPIVSAPVATPTAAAPEAAPQAVAPAAVTPQAALVEAAAIQAAIAQLSHKRDRVVQLTNAQRVANHLKALTVDARLQQSAQGYASHLAADGAFSHTDGSVLSTRITATGYVFVYAGENLAMGQTSASSVVAAWMASPDHRANMLDPRFTQMGVGIAERSDGRLIWCIDFGQPRP
jgi:uncharacterized protein YkwD